MLLFMALLVLEVVLKMTTMLQLLRSEIDCDNYYNKCYQAFFNVVSKYYEPGEPLLIYLPIKNRNTTTSSNKLWK